jgi:release factor glutamine methyltransferase
LSDQIKTRLDLPAPESATIGTILQRMRSRLTAAASDTPDIDARVIVESVLDLDWASLVRDYDRPVAAHEAERIDQLVARRLNHEPIAYLVGSREFWGLPFRVNKSTLIPRPDSETLVERAIVLAQEKINPLGNEDLTILDLGTGSGCLILALLSELEQARGVGVDSSADALEIARENAERLGLINRVDFIHGDWARDIERRFDLVIANPPYIAESDLSRLAPDVFQFEPHVALCGGADGLDIYRRLAKELPFVIKPGGYILLEIGIDQREDVEQIIFDGDHLMFLYGVPDLAGTIRCLVGQKPN